MEDRDTTELAKEALILAAQLKALYDQMEKAGDNDKGYQAFARSYNKALARAKVVLGHDKTMLRSIEHLTEFNPSDGLRNGQYNPNDDYSGDFENLKAEISVLRATLNTFFAFYMPEKDKQRIGFNNE